MGRAAPTVPDRPVGSCQSRRAMVQGGRVDVSIISYIVSDVLSSCMSHHGYFPTLQCMQRSKTRQGHGAAAPVGGTRKS